MQRFLKGLLFLLFGFSIRSQASLLLETQYDMAYHSVNSYTTSAGTSYSGSGNVDLRFLGLGGRYVFERVGLEIINLEVSGMYLFLGQNRTHNTFSIFEAGARASLSLGAHQPFIGLLYSRFYNSDNGPLSYKPDIGYQLGYRYAFGEHSVFANLTWRNLKSENPPTVNDQNTTLSMMAVGYSYQLF